MPMRQQTLHHYFPTTYEPAKPSSKLSLLHLPYDVRHRIYVFAGLVRFCPIDLNFEYLNSAVAQQEYIVWQTYNRDRAHDFNEFALSKCIYRKRLFSDDPWHSEREDTGMYCLCCPDPLPYNLLYVSRAIYDEVSFILYSENQFKICRRAPSGLSCLLNLGVRTLASLTSLSIRLNACSYIPGCYCSEVNEPGLCGDYGFLKVCIRTPDKPFGQVVSRHDKLFMSEWAEVCRRIAAHGTSRLRLSLLCDTGNLETAKKIAQPLEMAILGQCAILLGQDPTPELIDLAQAFALHTTKMRDTQPFRFTDLPGEIQDQILGYTDLVAPDDLEWSASVGLYVSCLTPSRRRCCRTCTSTLDACYCSRRHAAFSPSCTCWSFPLSIFRASRQVNSTATRIFYSQNHFIINQFEPDKLYDFRSVLEISHFLKRLPAHALPHLRSISWFLSKADLYNAQSMIPCASDASDWRDTIVFMARNLELWKLNLTLDISAGRGDNELESRIEHAIWDHYVRIVGPLSLLKQTHLKRKGLKNLFIHLSWPSVRPWVAAEGESPNQWGPQRLAGDVWEVISKEKPHSIEQRDEWAQILERRVMGRDYDSFARGKLRGFSKEEMNEAVADGPMCLVKHFRRRRPVLGPDGSQVWPTIGSRMW